MQVILLQPDNAPNFCFEVQAVGDASKSLFVQTDWDYPSIARTFGWDMSTVKRKSADEEEEESKPCKHNHTDGTVKCRDCGLEPSDFIAAAYDYLSENEGAIADDPGYFDNEEACNEPE
jgi:hypothetical protein